jgi:hypothetical protein
LKMGVQHNIGQCSRRCCPGNGQCDIIHPSSNLSQWYYSQFPQSESIFQNLDNNNHVNNTFIVPSHVDRNLYIELGLSSRIDVKDYPPEPSVNNINNGISTTYYDAVFHCSRVYCDVFCVIVTYGFLVMWVIVGLSCLWFWPLETMHDLDQLILYLEQIQALFMLDEDGTLNSDYQKPKDKVCCCAIVCFCAKSPDPSPESADVIREYQFDILKSQNFIGLLYFRYVL